ncbi:hypothetical protein [Mycolicibacterium sp.]|uniref:hypothetical protein n=1 Tax=Mycolicibacterium sp. TaxID=2320850 RepID=UPI003D141617
MQRYERALIEFAVRWAPFGGPSDSDIFEQFGIDRNRFLHILEELVSGGGAATGTAIQPLVKHLPAHWGPEEIFRYLSRRPDARPSSVAPKPGR